MDWHLSLCEHFITHADKLALVKLSSSGVSVRRPVDIRENVVTLLLPVVSDNAHTHILYRMVGISSWAMIPCLAYT